MRCSHSAKKTALRCCCAFTKAIHCAMWVRRLALAKTRRESVGRRRGQTAAVCVALAAVPVVAQLNERHAAGEEAKRMQTQLLAAQNEGATAQTEIERLRALSGRLEQSVAQAKEAAARAAASAQAFDAW